MPIIQLPNFRHDFWLTIAAYYHRFMLIFGLYNVFRRFVPNLIWHGWPPILTNKGEKTILASIFNYSPRILKLIKHWKEIISPLLLALPRSQCRCTVETDTCDRQIGCILLQLQFQRNNKPMSYLLHSLTDAELQYDKTHWYCPDV